MKPERIGTSGFDGLIGTHTDALEENSAMIASLLEALDKVMKEKNITALEGTNLKKFQRIQKTLNSIDKNIDKLGGK